MEQVVTSAIPLGRMGDKADIALACVYLASSAARCVALCYPARLSGHFLHYAATEMRWQLEFCGGTSKQLKVCWSLYAS